MPQSVATGTLAVEGLDKAFGATRVLDQAGLLAPAGRVVALLGPSGCGKMTLLRCIAGLERPDAGRVRLDGRDLSAPGAFVAPERRRIGMVFQDGALFPHLTVAGNVGYGLSREERRGTGSPRPWSWSTWPGSATACRPACPAARPSGSPWPGRWSHARRVLLLDEPFSNLDTILRVQIRAEVQRLLADLGVTAVFVTHDQEEAFVVGDEVAVMLAGRVVQQAAPAELYRAPAFPGGGRLPRRRQPAPGWRRPAWPTPPSGGCRPGRAGWPRRRAPAARAAAGQRRGGRDHRLGPVLRPRRRLPDPAARGGPCGCGCWTPPSSGPATPSTSTTSAARPSATRGPPLADPADLVILGAGPAGVGAAYRTARAGHRVVVLERAPGPAGPRPASSWTGSGSTTAATGCTRRPTPASSGTCVACSATTSSAGPATAASTWRAAGSGSRCARPTWPGGCRRRSRPGWPSTPPPHGPGGPGPTPSPRPSGPGWGRPCASASTSPTPASSGVSTPTSSPASRRRRRVSAGSWPAAGPVARGARRDGPWFWYPRDGFGTICERLATAAADGGAELRYRTAAERVELGPEGATVTMAGGERLAARRVWSTVPLPTLATMTDLAPSPAVLEAAGQLGFRAMVLVYLVLDGAATATTTPTTCPTPAPR